MMILAGKDQFTPIFEKLGAMVIAARNAFNRHSRQELERFKTLRNEVTSEIANALKSVEKPPAGEREAALKVQSILTRLQLITDKLGDLAGPIEKKIKDGILFSDKAVSQTNNLFDHQCGILRSILDILKTDNDMLKRYVLQETQRLMKNCNDFATEHEERMVEGLCLPQAAPLFLTILDNMRIAGQHEFDIVQILGGKLEKH